MKIVNISFNVRGEPIVKSPVDAFLMLYGHRVRLSSNWKLYFRKVKTGSKS